MRSEGYGSRPVCLCVSVSRPLIRYSRNYKTTQLQDQVDIPMDSVSCSLVFKKGVFRIMASFRRVAGPSLPPRFSLTEDQSAVHPQTPLKLAFCSIISAVKGDIHTTIDTLSFPRRQSKTSGSRAKHKDFLYPVGRITKTSLPRTKDSMASLCLSFKSATPMVAQLDRMAASTASIVKLAIATYTPTPCDSSIAVY